MSERIADTTAAAVCVFSFCQLILGIFEIVCNNPESILMNQPVWKPSFTVINPIVGATVADFMKYEGITNVTLFGFFVIYLLLFPKNLGSSLFMFIIFYLHKVIMLFLIGFVLWGEDATTPSSYSKDVVSAMLLAEFCYHLFTFVFGFTACSKPDDKRYVGTYHVYQQIYD